MRGDGPAADGDAGGYFGEWHQNETALGKSRMRQREAGLGARHIAESDEVDIDEPRPPPDLGIAFAAERRLDGKAGSEQRVRAELGAQLNGNVQEPFLRHRP